MAFHERGIGIIRGLVRGKIIEINTFGLVFWIRARGIQALACAIEFALRADCAHIDIELVLREVAIAVGIS